MKNEYSQYLQDRPELKSLIADYMQALLIAKPNDVLTFTARFFAPYSGTTSSNRMLPSLKQEINTPRF